MIAVCLIALFAFVALAVDLGMVAVSRTECQNAADVAALASCRVLNNKPGVVNSNLAQAVAVAKATVTGNEHMSTQFVLSQIQKIEAGQYLYDATTGTFRVSTWTDVTNNQSTSPASGSWTAIRVTLNVSQPTYFMRVFGVNSMPTGAVATAVFRPRDIAFVLDMTGSMAYASTFNFGGQSLNPDNLVMKAGHYVSVQDRLIATANQANSSGEAMSRNNFTIATPGGPPIVRCFSFDPVNVATPATPAYPVTVSGSAANLKNAFHRWSPPESGGDSTTYTPPTYNFAGYNAFHNGTESSPAGPTPAPASFGTMTDSGGITYVGDRWRRADGSINKTDATWATAAATTRAAGTAIELLGYNVSSGNVRGGTSGTTTITTEDKFRDDVWATYGYDTDIVKYRTQKGNGSPMLASTFKANNGNSDANILLPTADRFVGYSMGPGYWGKTFYIWPPDPRFDTSANLLSPNPAKPGFDTNGKPMCDWRRHFFLNRNSDPFDPQADNNPSTTTTVDGINEVLLNTGSGLLTANSTTNWRINYPAVLKWLKCGPQVLPPNLRAGRVLYYSSIPDDVDTSTGSDEQKKDKIFWKKYIDYVIGYSYTSSAYLYGTGDSWSSASRSIYTGTLNTWNGPTGTWSNVRPYMRYNDSPNRPRLHFWFGPLSMMDFIATAQPINWNPGTCTEAQCWQLKAGMNSVIDDVRANHPNDYVGMVMFAHSDYNDMRVPMGQDYTALKNALFFPKSLLSSINSGSLTAEVRPYSLSWTSVDGDEIPNANGSTDPNTGLAYAFNVLSPSSQLPSQYTTIVNGQPVRGRRGAGKTVIFETDGVPNSYRGLSSGTRTMNPTKKGYDTYYPTSTYASGNIGNGQSTTMSEAVKIVNQMVKPMATTNGTGVDSGLSLPNAPARVYPIGFGDIFDPVLAPDATFRPTALNFLADIGTAGGTIPSGGSLPSDQIITGTYAQRIDRLKNCMQRIFQSGLAVTLIE
jgi:hypothetical protein